MARTKIVTVRVERQPHHDAVLRLRAAYRWLRRLEAQPALGNPSDAPVPERIAAHTQEVLAWPR